MSKGIASSMTFAMLTMSVAIIVVFMGLQGNPLKMVEEGYLKEFNQRVLISTLNLLNDDNESAAALLQLRSCGEANDVEEFINLTINKMLRTGMHYIFQAGDLKLYDYKQSVNLTSISPARITFKTYCDSELEVIFGAYHEE